MTYLEEVGFDMNGMFTKLSINIWPEPNDLIGVAEPINMQHADNAGGLIVQRDLTKRSRSSANERATAANRYQLAVRSALPCPP